MKKAILTLAAGLCATIGLTAQADAAPIPIGGSETYVYSGFTPGTDNTCSVCSAIATFTLVDSNTLRIDITNTSQVDLVDGGNILSRLAVVTDPNIEYQAGTANFFGTPGWHIASTGVGQFTFEAETNGANDALQPGQGLSVTFDIQSTLTQISIVSSEAHWQQTGVGNEDSDKGPGTPPPPPVPEPGSMLLLGSGLALTARVVRRRRLQN